MEALLAFFATLVSLRLSADLVRRYRQRPAPGLLAWAAALGAFAAGSGAIAWGSAADWSNPAFRVYYLFGGLLTAPLLGLGSLLLVGVRAALPVTLVYCGLAVGVALAEPLTASVSGTGIPDASEHLDLLVCGSRASGPLRAVLLGGVSRRVTADARCPESARFAQCHSCR